MKREGKHLVLIAAMTVPLLLGWAPAIVAGPGNGPQSGGGSGNEPPHATFGYECDGFECLFDASDSSDPDGPDGKLTYAWDFGDGSSAAGVAPAHTYSEAGTYRVVLTVTDHKGATGQDPQDVPIEGPPPENTHPSASFTFQCTDLACDFDGSTSTDPEDPPETLDHSWDFGDGGVASGPLVSHKYAADGTYTVTLTVTDSGGLEDVATQDVTVSAPPPPPNTPPTANFTFACTDLSCDFDGTASADPEDGVVSAYSWDFGDGGTATGAVVSHDYAAAGTYTVTLTVTDSAGASDADSQPVTVSEPPPPPNQPPVAGFTFVCTDLSCDFDGTGSTDPEDGTPVSYAWDFGEGSGGTGQIVSHAYAAPGTYRVTLVVTDTAGASDEAAEEVTVVEPSEGPAASFTVQCDSLTCSFNASATVSQWKDTNELTYRWSFGDCTGGVGEQTQHAYSGSGWHQASLFVRDPDGSDSRTTDFFVEAGDRGAGMDLVLAGAGQGVPCSGVGRGAGFPVEPDWCTVGGPIWCNDLDGCPPALGLICGVPQLWSQAEREVFKQRVLVDARLDMVTGQGTVDLRPAGSPALEESRTVDFGPGECASRAGGIAECRQTDAASAASFVWMPDGTFELYERGLLSHRGTMERVA